MHISLQNIQEGFHMAYPLVCVIFWGMAMQGGISACACM